jgi:hypothetical protein
MCCGAEGLAQKICILVYVKKSVAVPKGWHTKKKY